MDISLLPKRRFPFRSGVADVTMGKIWCVSDLPPRQEAACTMATEPITGCSLTKISNKKLELNFELWGGGKVVETIRPLVVSLRHPEQAKAEDRLGVSDD